MGRGRGLEDKGDNDRDDEEGGVGELLHTKHTHHGELECDECGEHLVEKLHIRGTLSAVPGSDAVSTEFLLRPLRKLVIFSIKT